MLRISRRTIPLKISKSEIHWKLTKIVSKVVPSDIIIKRRTSVFSFAFPKGFGMTRMDSDLRNHAQIRTTKLVVFGFCDPSGSVPCNR